MAFVIADRVRETTTTTGTGSVTLAGAYTSFQTFSAAIGNGNNTYYTIASASSGEWEVGIGTYSSGGNLLSRDTVLASSAGGAKVTFSLGTKDVFVTQPAERSLLINAASNGLFGGSAAFTANGVIYANATTTATTGSTLTFDGSAFTAPTLNTTGTANIAGNVYLTTNATYYQSRTTGGTYIRMLGLNSANTAYVGPIDAGPGDMILNASSSSANIQFYTAGVERMRVDSATGGVGAVGIGYTSLTSVGNNGLAVLGNVGIGTSSPGAKLETSSTSAGSAVEVLRLSNPGAGANTQAQLKFFTTSTNYGTISGGYGAAAPQMTFDLPAGTPGNYVWQISSSTKMLLDTSGNLVVGNTSGSAKLESWYTSTAPSLSSSTGAGLSLRGTSTLRVNIGSDPSSPFGGWIQASDGGGTAFPLNLNPLGGNVGIGTSSPGSKLHIDGNFIRIEQTGANTAYFGNAADLITGAPAGAAIRFNNTALRIAYSSTQIAMFDSSGNLGLGVTPSAWSASSNAFQNSAGAIWRFGTNNVYFGQNYYWNGANRIYSTTNAATEYEQGVGSHKWYTAPSGTAGNAITFTQAMTLDASGNLSIGTTNVDDKVTVAGGGVALSWGDDRKFWMGFNNDYRIGMRLNAGTRTTMLFATGGAGDGGVITFNTRAATASGPTDYGTERARIISSGYSKFSNDGTYLNGSGTNHEMRQSASDIITYFTNKNATNPYGIEIDYTALDPNGTGNSFFAAYGTTTLRAGIRSNGGIANYSANNVALSDRREKTNFAPAKSYLDTICAIPVQTFNYIDQPEDDPGLTLGVVAQDVQAVAPELVSESNWGTEEDPKMRLSIYQTDLQYALMKAIQELKAEFDAYKATHP